MKFEPIIIEEKYRSSVDQVWKAITDPAEMRKWYFDAMKSFKPEVGFRTEFNVKTPERDFLHMWKVTEVIPGKKIVYNWKYEGYAGDSFVTWELTKEKDLTKLKLTHEVKEPFPQDIPEFKRESGVQGWTFFLRERLKEFLEKRKR